MTSLEQIDRVTHSDEIQNSVNELVKQAYLEGVNANICSSLLRMKSDLESVEIETTASYSSIIAPMDDYVISLKDKHFYVIEKIENAYLDNSDEEKVELSGLVTHLSRSEDEHSGIIKIKTEIEGRSRTLTVFLEARDYENAIIAHQEKKLYLLMDKLI